MLTARRRDQHPPPAARHLAFMYWPFWALRQRQGRTLIVMTGSLPGLSQRMIFSRSAQASSDGYHNMPGLPLRPHGRAAANAMHHATFNRARGLPVLDDEPAPGLAVSAERREWRPPASRVTVCAGPVGTSLAVLS